MKKLIAWGTGGFAAVSAGVMSAALLSTPVANSIPAYHVADLPYGQAKAILQDQGIEVVNITKHGNDLPLAQCIVTSYTFAGEGMELWLNCKKKE